MTMVLAWGTSWPPRRASRELPAGAAAGRADGHGACRGEDSEVRHARLRRCVCSRPASDLIFLDVRTPQERSYGAIPGTRLVSIYDLMQGAIPLPKDKPILLVCAVGGRSYVAAQVMSRQGFQEVYNLSGGIRRGWRRPAADAGPRGVRAAGKINGSAVQAAVARYFMTNPAGL